MRQIAVVGHEISLSPTEKGQWEQLGKVQWLDAVDGYTADQLAALLKETEYLAFCPSVFGGFGPSVIGLIQLLPQLSQLKALVLNTTAFDYVPLEICQNQQILVTNVPAYSRESVAEHTLAMMLGGAKRVFISDRDTQHGNYHLIEGFELANKILGVIGLGSIGSRVAELGRAIGMQVLAWDRQNKYLPGITQVSLDALLPQADVVSLHLRGNFEKAPFLSQERIARLKLKSIVINTTMQPGLIDETALATALTAGKIDTYIREAENFEEGPLATAPNVISLKGFGWYTHESLERNKQIWLETMQSIIAGTPINIVGTLR